MVQHRARVARLSRALVSFIVVAAGLAAPQAQAAGPLVQVREPGTRLTAQRYEAPSDTVQKLSIAYAPGATADSVTAFDFDRDGKPDATAYVHELSSTSAVVELATVSSSTYSTDCLRLDVGTRIGSDFGTAITAGTNRRLVSFTMPAGWRSTLGAAVQYQPIVATYAGDNLGGSSAGDTTVQDYLPNSAAGATAGSPGTLCHVNGNFAYGGNAINMKGGTDRGFVAGATPAGRQPMTDLASSDGNADLLGAEIDMYNASQPSSDATADTAGNPPTAATHPTDLVLTFGGPATSAALDATTWIAPGTTAGQAGGAPIGIVRTERLSSTTARLHLSQDMPWSGFSGSAVQCYQQNGADAPFTAPELLVDVPVVADGNGHPVVRVALDRLVRVYQDGATNAEVIPFRWASATLPAGPATPDYVPDTAGAPDSGPAYSRCTPAGAGADTGVQMDPRRLTRFGFDLPTPTLSAPGTVQRQVATTLTATNGTNYAFDATATGRFDAFSASATRSNVLFGQPTLARVIAQSNSGTQQMATLQVNPVNAPPNGTFTPRTTTFALPCAGGAVTVQFTGAGTDPDNNTPLTYGWVLSQGATTVATGASPTFARTISSPGTYTLRLTVGDAQAGLDPSPDALTFTVADGTFPCGAGAPTAALERIDPASGPVFAKRAVTFSAAGSSVPAGGARYAFDLDGDGIYETDAGDQATTTTTYPAAGTRTVGVRVTDAASHSATATLAVDVRPEPVLAPAVTLAAPASVTLGADGTATATLDASGSTGRNDDPSLTYAFDTDGDGTYDRGTGGVTSTTVTFTSAGTRTVRVRATDVYGNTAEASREIIVRGAADIAAGCSATSSYRTVSFGFVRATACFASVRRPNAGPLWMATGALNLNGLIVTGAQGSTRVQRTFTDCSENPCAAANATFNAGDALAIVLDPYDGRIVTNAPVAIKATGTNVNLPLSLSPLDVTLPLGVGDDGFIVRVPNGTALFGLPVSGEAEVRFPSAGTTRVRINVGMPAALPHVSAEVDVNATPAQGVVLDRLHLDAGMGALGGKLVIKQLALDYDRATDLWDGQAKVSVPSPRPFDLAVEVMIQGGRFKSIYGEVNSLNQPIADGIFLQRIAAGVGVDPLDLRGGIGISAGPRVFGRTLLRVDGDVHLRFPSALAPYTLFELTGEATIAEVLPLAHGYVQFTDNGFVAAGGGIGGDYEIGYVKAEVNGWLSGARANIDGDAEVGLLVDGHRIALLGGHAVVSTKGFAACGEIPVIDLGGGFGAYWSDMSLDIFEGCDLDPYREARPADAPANPFAARASAAAVRGRALVLPRGLKSVALQVRGRGGVPKVRVIDVKGRTLLEAGRDGLSARQMVLSDAKHGIATVLWKAPPAGRFYVVAEPGSPAIASVKSALGRPQAKVKVTVARRPGGRRLMTWKASPALARGQSLVLTEDAGKAGSRHVLTTTKSAGHVAFTPLPGPGGTRRITAAIESDGLMRPAKVVARYAVPAPKAPAAPKALVIRRNGRVATATWKPVAQARRYRVAVVAGAGRTLLREVRTPRLAIGDVAGAQAVSVNVTAIGPVAGVTGRSASALLRAGASRSGAAASLKVSGVRARRSGRALVVTWRPSADRVAGYAVTVTPRKGKAIVLRTRPKIHTVKLATAPAAGFKVTVRALPLTT